MKTLIRRLLLLIVLAAAGAGLYFGGEKYLWPTPDLSTINAVGIIEAPEVNVTSRIQGRIAEITVIEGDTVKRGQLICRIESTDIENQLRKAQADLLKARADLADAQRIERRYRELVREKVISQEQYDSAATRVEAQRAAVASASASINYYADQWCGGEQGAGSRRMGQAGHYDSDGRRPVAALGARQRAGERIARAHHRQARHGHAADQTADGVYGQDYCDWPGRGIRHRARRAAWAPGYPHLLRQGANPATGRYG